MTENKHADGFGAALLHWDDRLQEYRGSSGSNGAALYVLEIRPRGSGQARGASEQVREDSVRPQERAPNYRVVAAWGRSCPFWQGHGLSLQTLSPMARKERVHFHRFYNATRRTDWVRRRIPLKSCSGAEIGLRRLGRGRAQHRRYLRPGTQRRGGLHLHSVDRLLRTERTRADCCTRSNHTVCSGSIPSTTRENIRSHRQHEGWPPSTKRLGFDKVISATIGKRGAPVFQLRSENITPHLRVALDPNAIIQVSVDGLRHKKAFRPAKLKYT
jgi:hypothetical protein